MPSRIVIVSGPPGAGKSTTARRLAGAAPGDLAVHLHTDDFYAYIQKGFVEPWLPAAQRQNITIMQALSLSAATFARNGYEVLVDGIVGSWFFDPWIAAARENQIDLRYVLLMPDEASTVARAVARTAPGAMTDPQVVRTMWNHFRSFPLPDGHVVDTTRQTADETFTAIRDGLAAGQYVLSG